MLTERARGGEERPATFRDVLGASEFRAIYAASALSWAGDYIARAAITVLVFQTTESVTASAAAFAISYAPWLLGGSLLVSLADRIPYRTVMIFCDLVRMCIMAAVALPDLPLALVLLLLLASALFSPPFDAARSATIPSILRGDRYVVGIGLLTATSQPIQVAGYFAGASLAAVYPHEALLVNAGTFAASAVLVRFGVRRRPSSGSTGSHLLRDTVDGFRLVFQTAVLRAPVLLVLCGSLFAIVPEALAAAWAFGVAAESDRGLAQGMIMGSVPLGSILGALTVSRLAAPSTKLRLMRPLALATPLALVPALFDPPAVIVALLAGACGFAIGGLVPIANGQFVKALPKAFRARAFGVVQGGLALLQGAAVLLTGALAHSSSVPVVVGLWSLGGVGLMVMLSLSWPSASAFADAIASTERANAAIPAQGMAGQGGGGQIDHRGTAPRPTPAPGTIEA